MTIYDNVSEKSQTKVESGQPFAGETSEEAMYQPFFMCPGTKGSLSH